MEQRFSDGRNKTAWKIPREDVWDAFLVQTRTLQNCFDLEKGKIRVEAEKRNKEYCEDMRMQ